MFIKYECSINEALIRRNEQSIQPLMLQFMQYSGAHLIDSDGKNPLRKTFYDNIELGLQVRMALLFILIFRS